MSSLGKYVAAIGLIAILAPSARSQGVAFQPTIGVIPDGVGMTVVPVASADRRYVRVGVNASFVGFEGFSTFPIPAAVGGGGIGGGLGGGGLGGLGGLPGGLGGAGAGQGQVAGGGNFDVGMDGIVDPFRPAQSYGPMAGFDQTGFGEAGFGQAGFGQAGLPFAPAMTTGQVPTTHRTAPNPRTTKARLAAIKARQVRAEALAKTRTDTKASSPERPKASAPPTRISAAKKKP
jgi:hypothetical protein